MRTTHDTDYHARHILDLARRHPRRWLLPLLLIGGLGSAYALVHRPEWEARQALTVRDPRGERQERFGQLTEAEQWKDSQETFLELARSPAVLAAALRTVGPPASCRDPATWPEKSEVAAMREQTQVVAPNGLEFGTTGLFYLQVADPDPQRAVTLATAVCDESERHFRALRDKQIRDTIAQLTNTVELASRQLEHHTAQLRDMEVAAGSDLTELRMLSEPHTGGSSLQTTLAELRQELRHVETRYSANEQLLTLLTSAQEDPATLVATPNQLLEAQPALRRLKDGLIDAQLNSSQLLGTMSAPHPRVQAAMVAETEIRGHLHGELELAVRGLRAEQSVLETQMRTLTGKVEDLQRRLQRLAEMRASYSAQQGEVQQRLASLASSRQELHSAQASLAAGRVTDLVTRVDVPQTGPYPKGPGRVVIAAAAWLGGLLAGLGVFVLTLPTVPAPAGASPPESLSAAPVPAPRVQRTPKPIEFELPARPTPGPRPATAPSAAVAYPPVTRAAPMPVLGSRASGMTLKDALLHCGVGSSDPASPCN